MAITVLLLALCLSLGAPPAAGAADRFKPFKMASVDGRELRLREVMGKATLVVFFFPTCGFCNAWLPEAKRIHEAYRERGLAMVWINVVPKENRLVAGWQASSGLDASVLFGGGSAVRDYKVTMTPTHYLLDAEGRVAFTHAGYQQGDGVELERRIAGLLAVGP